MKKLLLSVFVLCTFIINAQSPISSIEMLLEVNPIIKSGMENIGISIKNTGNNVLNSAEINWQVDGSPVYTQRLNGLALAPNAIYNFTHHNKWNATPGTYTLKVWVSELNNNQYDAEISTIVKVASNSVQKYPLFEKFTSSSCPPCAPYNVVFGNFQQQNPDLFTVINYQMNWPGAGDPYYTAEAGLRRTFYNINAVPSVVFRGQFIGNNPGIALLTNQLNIALAQEAFFEINADFVVTDDIIDIDVEVMPYIEGAYTLRVVVIENLTTQNASTNGETSFKNVMMKMVPNPAGTLVEFEQDVAYTTSFSIDLSGTFIEEMDDLDVIVFIQDDTATPFKEVMQSQSVNNPQAVVLSTINNELASTINLYPNPTTGILRINTETPVDIQIYDITGKLVYSQGQLTKNNEMDLSFLNKGIYIAKMTNENTQQTKKVIIK